VARTGGPQNGTPLVSIFVQMAIGIAMLAITVAINAYCIVKSGTVLDKMQTTILGPAKTNLHILTITVITLWLSLVMLCAMVLWAALLSGLGLFETMIDALYFSMISFTTLGFGDVLLPREWGLLSGFIATDGFILFGLNTATLFEVLRRLRDTGG